MKRTIKKFFTIFLCALILLGILQNNVIISFANELNNRASNDVPVSNEEIISALNKATFTDSTMDSAFVLSTSDIEENEDYFPSTANIYDIEFPSVQYDRISKNQTRSGNENFDGDIMVYYVQKWLNQEYGNVSGFGSVTENGKTGWETIYGLLRALQHELGITELANSFGPTTSSRYSQNILRRQDGTTNKMYAILQSALWCKGYNPGYNIYERSDGTISFNEVFDEDVENAVKLLQSDAGLATQDGVVSLNIMKALMSMDSFKLLPSSYGSDANVRYFQQWLNCNFENYAGLSPCDGVYGRNTNKALIYAFQATEGLPVNVANGNFGNTTKLCCPQLPYFENSSAARCYPGSSDCSFYQYSKIHTFTKILQFALYVNGFGSNNFDGIYSNETRQAVRECQEFYALPVTGVADKTTWLSLVISSGDKTRSAIAADCATILTTQKATALYNSGYRYIGRYLTGTYNGGISKALTRTEAEIILDAGLNFFPIYQTSARQCEYFTPEQGVLDAKEAINAAKNLGLPDNTIIYYAVDFDALDYQITSNILPYFEKVSEEMASCTYRTGVYGARNVCSRVSNQGYACSSFVGDMSTGFSGNLGFKMPDNWAFDQFSDKDADGNYIQINSSDGSFPIDKDGFSGRDQGVSVLKEVGSGTISDNMFVNESSESDTLIGPTINVFGQDVPLFQTNISMNFNIANVQSIYDAENKETKVLFGIKALENQTETSGYREKVGKYNQAFKNTKTTLSLLGKNKKEFENVYKDFKGSLYDSGTTVGFNGSMYFFGYLVLNKDLQIIESGAAIVGEANASISYPLVTGLYAKFRIEGSIRGSITFTCDSEGSFDKTGDFSFSVAPSLGIEANLILARAYSGLRGELECELTFQWQGFENSFTADFTASLFFEWEALGWGNSYKWDFSNIRLYPHSSRGSVIVDRNDFEFIQAKSHSEKRLGNRELYPNVLVNEVQIYAHPQIVYLGNNSLFMTYIDNSTLRTNKNQAILMYSIYDGTNWSVPQPVFDDNTADYDAKICSDGIGGVHVLWQNANIIFNDNSTLEQMSENMDLYYTHWNGSTFDNTIAITTNNQDLEMSHQIISNGNDISVVWQTNSNNDSFTMGGTNTINRRQYANSTWQPTEQIATGLSLINSISTSYSNGVNIIAYSTKCTSNTSSVNDLEVYYYDGNQISRITNDSIPDYSVKLINDELFWLSNGEIVSIINGNYNTIQTHLDLSKYSITNFDIVSNGTNKSIIWEYEDANGMIFFASNYDNQLLEFTTPRPLSRDNGVVRGWSSCLNNNGNIELLFSYANYLNEPINNKNYGTLALIQKSAESYSDLYVNSSLYYEGDVKPNETITLMPELYNMGSTVINGVRINILDSNNTVVQSTINNSVLDIGGTEILEIPFTLPQNLVRTDYTIFIESLEEGDINDQNNSTVLSVGYADLAIESIDELRTNEGRKLRVKVKNNGYETVYDAQVDFLSEGIEGPLLSSTQSITLSPNEELYIYFLLDESYSNSLISEEPRIIFVQLTSTSKELNYTNNDTIYYVFPDYQITAVSESLNGTVSGTGTYQKDELVQLTASPNQGYVFDGWYEDGVRIGGASETYSFFADRNHTLYARFILLEQCDVLPHSGSTGSIDYVNNYLYGIEPGYQIDDYFYITNNGFFKQLAGKSGFTNATGAEVHVTSENGTVVDVFYIVILGDVNGDSAIDAFDLFCIDLYISGYRQYEGAYLEACDLNQDGNVDEDDYNLCRDIVLGL